MRGTAEKYKSTDLSEDQFNFLVDWCNGLQRIKNTRSSDNLKILVEHLFFYISGDDMHVVMKAAGIKGDRWNHNVSAKHIKKIRQNNSRRGWYNTIEERLQQLDYRDFL